ncbi:MAG: sigma-70 family RNA polymerase sigma factor [Candidatus Poribacteria bacterium]|nr:sigma-70 family RNA polymerase sigma factor [Candidatus Poribacteria bacterium]
MKAVKNFSSEREIEDDALHRWFLESANEEALSLLMRRYYEPIRASVTKIIGNHHDADEITNETFLKAFNKRDMIKYPDKLVGWLYTTAKNVAIDQLRDRQQEVNQMHEFFSLDNVDGEREAADASMLAVQQAQQTEIEHYLLRRLLRLLSEKELEIIEHLLDGLRPREIAEAIGSTAEAVQKRWERILKWLRPIAHQLDELIDNLPPQERKIMERYLDNQPFEDITKKESISPTDVEVCVKRVVKRWKKTVTQNATTKVKRENN